METNFTSDAASRIESAEEPAAVPASDECPNCGAKGDEQCHDTEGPPARFVSRHRSRPSLGDRTSLFWEYQGDGLVLCWLNPYNNAAKETVAMLMWPSHAPDKTEEIEQLYERMADTFVSAWNGDPVPASKPDPSTGELTEHIVRIRRIVGSFLSSDDNVDLFAKNAPKWTRALVAWYEDTACPVCDGAEVVDSGGVTPEGSGIEVRCGACDGTGFMSCFVANKLAAPDPRVEEIRKRLETVGLVTPTDEEVDDAISAVSDDFRASDLAKQYALVRALREIASDALSKLDGKEQR